jgi:hypothetical protein
LDTLLKNVLPAISLAEILRISVSARQTISLLAAPQRLGPALGLVRNY